MVNRERAIVADLLAAQIPWLMRGKDQGVCDLTHVKDRLALPAYKQFVYSESGMCRDLFDYGDLPVTVEGHRSRVIIATHPAETLTDSIGVTRDGVAFKFFHSLACAGLHRRQYGQALFITR